MQSERKNFADAAEAAVLGYDKEYVKSEIAHSFLGREELATLGHRCGVPIQKDGIRKMQKPEMGSETDSETKQHLKDRNAEKEV